MKDIPDLNRSATPVARFFRWLFSPRIARRCLIGFGIFFTLIAVVYAEENLRGHRALAKYKRDLDQLGEAWDWSAFMSTPVPDDQNILKAPHMSEWFVDRRPIFEKPLDNLVTNALASRLINTNSTVEITNIAQATQYLAWSDQFLAEFEAIASALKRPHARMEDYSHPLFLSLPNAVTAREVLFTVEQRAKCHLLLGETEKAWNELTLMRALRRLIEGQGNFLTTEGDWMIRGIIHHSLTVIARGLELHAWKEPQLLMLQDWLKNDDVIALHARALRGARAVVLVSVESGDLLRAYRRRLTTLFSLVPRGTLEHLFVRKANDFQRIISAYSPTNGITRPSEVSQASAWWPRAQEGTPALLRTQTLINEGLVACALERYRLAHQEYPEALDALTPEYLKQLPFDIVNGKPLNYQRTNDGKFLLYSVGWNETDDGGKDVSNPSHPDSLKEGDWAWTSRL